MHAWFAFQRLCTAHFVGYSGYTNLKPLKPRVSVPLEFFDASFACYNVVASAPRVLGGTLCVPGTPPMAQGVPAVSRGVPAVFRPAHPLSPRVPLCPGEVPPCPGGAQRVPGAPPMSRRAPPASRGGRQMPEVVESKS